MYTEYNTHTVQMHHVDREVFLTLPNTSYHCRWTTLVSTISTTWSLYIHSDCRYEQEKMVFCNEVIAQTSRKEKCMLDLSKEYTVRYQSSSFKIIVKTRFGPLLVVLSTSGFDKNLANIIWGLNSRRIPWITELPQIPFCDNLFVLVTMRTSNMDN